jgi:AraC family transcriptional regulator, regulatory protein of adaptative response / DNA-3-methyladenine glycosylase II
MREVFRASPTDLRSRRHRADRLAADGGLTMRLPFRAPLDWDGIVAFLARRAVPGVESVDGRVYRRTISLDGAAGVLEVHPGGEDHLLFRAHLPYWEGLIHVGERVSRMIGLDADPSTRRGTRVPGAWGPLEVATHAILAQDCSLTDAAVYMGALVQSLGQPVPGLTHGLTHLFPSAEVLAGADLSPIAIPRAAAEPIRALAFGLTSGDIVLDGSLALAELLASLSAIPGIGTVAANEIALRLDPRAAATHSDMRALASPVL